MKEYGVMSDKIELAHERAQALVARRHRKIICLVGRRKDWRLLREAEVAETLAGNIVLTVGCIGPDGPVNHPEEVHGEVECRQLHFDKIHIADEVVHAHNGYTGEHTANDLEFARQMGKPIREYAPLVSAKPRYRDQNV